MSKKPEWTQFAVGEPSTRQNWVNPDCTPLTEVYHIAHVTDALRIFEDRIIRSSLVWDESRLCTKRTCVSWVSPNDWWQGSLYGNVRFAFDWKKLVKGKRFYWVETLTTMRQRVVRFLITTGDFTDEPLDEYDPTSDKGPLWHDTASDTWYCNLEGITNEYMLVNHLPAEAWMGLTFVSHHPQYCAKSGSKCTDMGHGFGKAGALVLARLLAADDRELNRLFLNEDANRIADFHVALALRSLRKRVVGLCERKSGKALLSAQRKATLQAVLMAISCGRTDQAEALATFFPNAEALGKAFDGRVKKYFDGAEVKLR